MDEPTVRFDLDPLVAPREGHLRGYRQRVPTEPAYEVVSEFAHIVAGYAAIDGAVVMTHHCEMLCFGGEISGDLEPVLSVDRAMDPEGKLTVREGVRNVGTRHRSAYRLARATPDAVSVVVSQDGSTRFVTDRANVVTCRDQPWGEIRRREQKCRHQSPGRGGIPTSSQTEDRTRLLKDTTMQRTHGGTIHER